MSKSISQVRIGKLIGIALPVLVLSVLLGAQALSSVAMRTDPALASQLFPGNGMAEARHAFGIFQNDIAEGEDPTAAAGNVRSMALSALSSDPLAARAYSLIALSQTEENDESEVLARANTLNRRELSLQGLYLQDRLQAGDFPNSISTLNQIMRVHTNRRAELFPVLLDAFVQPQAAASMVSVLNSDAAWIELFLRYAAGSPEGQQALASIRKELKYENPQIDRRLIAGLAVQGDIAGAKDMYDYVKSRQAGDVEENAGAWGNEYPPFDWRLSDEPRFRAQPDRQGENLEIFVRTGEGGSIADLIKVTPSTPFAVTTSYETQSPSREDNVRVQLRCAANAEPFVDAALVQGRNRIVVDALPANCPQMLVSLNARAWTGEPTLRASLSPIVIAPL